MGIVYTKIKVRNPLGKKKATEVEAKVDTGATMLVLPGSIAKEYDFPKIREETVKFANEKREKRQVVWGVEVEICGRKGMFEAIIEPRKEYPLVGAIVMETLDLIIEPRSFKIYPNPRSPDMPMAEIE